MKRLVPRRASRHGWGDLSALRSQTQLLLHHGQKTFASHRNTLSPLAVSCTSFYAEGILPTQLLSSSWGKYVPFSKESAELLFQVLAERHERGSVIITTNLGFADWTQVFDDATLTAALLDRLTHKAHIIHCT